MGANKFKMFERAGGLKQWLTAQDIDSTPIKRMIGTEQAREVSRGVARTAVPVMVLALTIGICFANAQNGIYIWTLTAFQVTVATSAQLWMPFTSFSRVHYRTVAACFQAFTFYTFLISLGWGLLFTVASIGADPGQHMTLLAIHVGVICVGGLTFAMIPRAALVYIFNIGLLAQAHIFLVPGETLWLLSALVLLFSMMLAQAYMQMGEQFVERMKANIERRDAERKMAEAERQELERSAAATLAARTERERDKERAMAERQQAMLALASHYEQSVASLAEHLDDAVNALALATESITGIHARARDKAQHVLDLATSTTDSVESVARATGALNEAAVNIASQSEEQMTIGDAARHASENGLRSLAALSDQTDSVGEIIRLIQDLAGQTGLLSLNATIEAARAGEAGRGFVIVANEVKQLAAQTHNAVARIDEIIAGTRERVGEAGSAMRSIAETIGKITDRGSVIGNAVMAQRQSTWDISEAASRTASASQQVRTTADQVARSTKEADDLAEEIRTIVKSLRTKSEALHSTSNAFLRSLREDEAPIKVQPLRKSAA